MASILVCGPSFPRPDHSGGSLRLFEMLKLLVLKHDVALWANGPDSDGAHRRLASMGVRVFRSRWRGIDRALIAKRYDMVLCEYWHYAETIRPLVLWYQPDAKFIVDSVDIHFLREELEASYSKGDENAEGESRKNRELEVYRQADGIVIVSDEDATGLREEIPDLESVFYIPNIVSGSVRPDIKRDLVLIFVGYFEHAPNKDGILWFVEHCWPRIQERVPGVILNVVGGYADNAIKDLSKLEGIRVLGYVPEMQPYLDEAAVSIAPLRFGAGMKVKVTEALMGAMPVVSTTVGAQGFNAVSGEHMVIADEPLDFAKGVVELLQHPDRAEAMGRSGRALCEKICSPKAVGVRLNDMVKTCCPPSTRKMISLRLFIMKCYFYGYKAVRLGAKKIISRV